MTKRLTYRQAVVVSLYTGYACGVPPKTLAKEASKILGYKVTANQLANNNAVRLALRVALNDEFLAICWKPKPKKGEPG